MTSWQDVRNMNFSKPMGDWAECNRCSDRSSGVGRESQASSCPLKSNSHEDHAIVKKMGF